mgnify:CR=1 FL=1
MNNFEYSDNGTLLYAAKNRVVLFINTKTAEKNADSAYMRTRTCSTISLHLFEFIFFDSPLITVHPDWLSRFHIIISLYIIVVNFKQKESQSSDSEIIGLLDWDFLNDSCEYVG